MNWLLLPFVFFGLQVIQESNMSITIHGDEKLNSIACFPISRNWPKMVDEILNEVELRSFRSINSSLSWLGTNIPLFFALHSSWLQQKAPDPKFQDMIMQINSLRHLQKLGTSLTSKHPIRGSCQLSLIVFADASRKSDHGLLCFISGLLFG